MISILMSVYQRVNLRMVVSLKISGFLWYVQRSNNTWRYHPWGGTNVSCPFVNHQSRSRAVPGDAVVGHVLRQLGTLHQAQPGRGELLTNSNHQQLPSGKHTKNYGKSQFLKGKSTSNGHVQ